MSAKSTGLEEHFRLQITIPFPGGMNLLRGRRRAEETECDALKEKGEAMRMQTGRILDFSSFTVVNKIKTTPPLDQRSLGIEPNMTQYHWQH